MEKIQKAEEFQEEVKEEKVEEEQATTSEEKPVKTYTEEEFNKAVEEQVKAKLDEARKNGFAEGERKASKKLNEDLKNENQDLKDRLATLENEMTMQKHFQTLTNLNVVETKKSDVLDLIRGKGLEINEENITKVVEEHPEWITPKEKKGVVELGQNNKTTQESQEEIDNKRIMADFRKRLGLKN